MIVNEILKTGHYCFTEDLNGNRYRIRIDVRPIIQQLYNFIISKRNLEELLNPIIINSIENYDYSKEVNEVNICLTDNVGEESGQDMILLKDITITTQFLNSPSILDDYVGVSILRFNEFEG